MFCFFRRGFFRKGILAGDERKGGTAIPFHTNLPHTVYMENRALGTRRRCLRIIHVI